MGCEGDKWGCAAYVRWNSTTKDAWTCFGIFNKDLPVGF